MSDEQPQALTALFRDEAFPWATLFNDDDDCAGPVGDLRRFAHERGFGATDDELDVAVDRPVVCPRPTLEEASRRGGRDDRRLRDAEGRPLPAGRGVTRFRN